jgi:hypothetical protein
MISEQSKEKIALICLKKCVRHEQVRASMQAAAATRQQTRRLISRHFQVDEGSQS